MKKAFALILIIIFLSGCASLQFEKFWPLSQRLLSKNNTIKKATVAEFVKATDQQKKKTVLEIVEMFAMEENDQKRKEMLDTLLDLKVGAYAIIPLVQAAGRNMNITSVDDIAEAILKLKPTKAEMAELGKMLLRGSETIKKLILSIMGR